MKSYTLGRFWKFYDRLPAHVQRDVDEAYKLWQVSPYHPSLQFKRVDPQDPIYSVRIGRGYRALGWYDFGVVTWFWIGDHDEYMRVLKQL